MSATPLFQRLEEYAAAWLQRRKEVRLMRRFGGIQWCPWCRQVAQSNAGGWSFKEWEGNQFHDVLTCGVCSGTSVWHFAMGMIPVGPLDPPPPCPDFPDHTERDRRNLSSPNTHEGKTP